MRILLATDGSPSAAAASRLAAGLHWPSGSVIDVVGVCDAHDEGLCPDSEEVAAAVGEAVAVLTKAGLIARRLVLTGRPATLIVDVASDFRAELVIVGSRGLGPLASMLLGSVSAEVVDHAPCPVLVVRDPEIRSVLVAVDGSGPARAAVDYLSSTRILAGRRVEVLSVAHGRTTVPPELMTTLPVAIGGADGLFREEREERERTEVHAALAADELRRSGHDTRWSISCGNAAHEIVTTANSLDASLIVMGSRGLTGISRVVLGSVARNVLLHTPASVLIVHEPLREDSPERRRAVRPARLPAAGR